MHINFTAPENGVIVLPNAENRMIVSSCVWTKHWNVTDGRTDRHRYPKAITVVCIVSNADTL